MVAHTDLHEMVDSILAQLVPAALPQGHDLQALVDHRDWLLAQEDALVALFYDTLYDYPATAAVFVDGERVAREQTLRNWWQRTVGTPIDIDYFRWMAFVGIVHIRRGVTNPMMLSMLQVVSGHVVTSARAALGDRAAVDLQEAFSRISTTVGAVIAEAYTRCYVGALEDLAGLDPKLTARMLSLEVSRIETESRQQLT